MFIVLALFQNDLASNSIRRFFSSLLKTLKNLITIPFCLKICLLRVSQMEKNPSPVERLSFAEMDGYIQVFGVF